MRGVVKAIRGDDFFTLKQRPTVAPRTQPRLFAWPSSRRIDIRRMVSDKAELRIAIRGEAGYLLIPCGLAGAVGLGADWESSATDQ